jgi:hypothetical protein
MANYFARKAGNVNATDVWATTPSGTAADVFSTFTSSDVLHSNNFAITVNVNTTVGSVRNDNANSATAGGGFTLNNSITLTANAFAGSTGTACVTYSGGVGNSATFVGNATAGTASGAQGVSNTSTGTLTVTGNGTGGSNNCHGVNNQSTGTITMTGNATGGSVGGAFGVRNLLGGTVTMTGNATGGTGGIGAENASTGTLTITGSAIASSVAIGANNTSTGTLTVTRAVGNAYGIGAAGGTASVVGLASVNVASDTRAQEFEYGENGQTPTSGAVKVVSASNNKCIVELTTSAQKTLADPSDGTGQAAIADVRSGTSYALGNLTGTCAVPAASSVAFGVPVDATTGTAALTPAAVWDALTSGMTTSGSIGARLKNAATVDTTGQSLADALTPAP